MQLDPAYLCVCAALHFQKCVYFLETVHERTELAITATQGVLLHATQVFVLFFTH